MPRNPQENMTYVQKVRQYAREHKGELNFDIAYQLMSAAITADGLAPTRTLPDSELNALTEEQEAKLAAAKSAVGLA